MTTEIEIRKDQRPILMKSGLVHWCSEATADRAQEALNAQSGHSFMKVIELGITINTAQIEGIYTIKQYEDIVKLKQGMWQCEYRQWHERKNECGCKAKITRKRNEELRRIREQQENREPTHEERARASKKIDEITEELRQKGIIGGKSLRTTQEFCVKCPNKVPHGAKYYCSGACWVKAKEDGTFGREEELKEAANTI